METVDKILLTTVLVVILSCQNKVRTEIQVDSIPTNSVSADYPSNTSEVEKRIGHADKDTEEASKSKGEIELWGEIVLDIVSNTRIKVYYDKKDKAFVEVAVLVNDRIKEKRQFPDMASRSAIVGHGPTFELIKKLSIQDIDNDKKAEVYIVYQEVPRSGCHTYHMLIYKDQKWLHFSKMIFICDEHYEIDLGNMIITNESLTRLDVKQQKSFIDFYIQHTWKYLQKKYGGFEGDDYRNWYLQKP